MDNDRQTSQQRRWRQRHPLATAVVLLVPIAVLVTFGAWFFVGPGLAQRTGHWVQLRGPKVQNEGGWFRCRKLVVYPRGGGRCGAVADRLRGRLADLPWLKQVVVRREGFVGGPVPDLFLTVGRVERSVRRSGVQWHSNMAIVVSGGTRPWNQLNDSDDSLTPPARRLKFRGKFHTSYQGHGAIGSGNTQLAQTTDMLVKTLDEMLKPARQPRFGRQLPADFFGDGPREASEIESLTDYDKELLWVGPWLMIHRRAVWLLQMPESTTNPLRDLAESFQNTGWQVDPTPRQLDSDDFVRPFRMSLLARRGTELVEISQVTEDKDRLVWRPKPGKQALMVRYVDRFSKERQAELMGRAFEMEFTSDELVALKPAMNRHQRKQLAEMLGSIP